MNSKAKSSQKWMQKASKEMEKKGTKGSFTKLAKEKDGYDKKNKRIKSSFIEKELKSPNPSIRKKANFAKNVRKA